MSIQNLDKKNNYELFCKKITVDEYEIDTIVVDNIVVNNATVLTQVTTPHINSGTSVFNTVGTINLDAVNGTIGTLDSNTATIDNLTVNNSLTVPSLTTPTINCTNINASNNLTVGNTATINTLNVNTTITAPNVNTNNLTAPNGNISNLNSSTITASNANLDSISGSNLSYGTGNIGDISGSNLNYDTGYIATSSAKRLEIFTELIACPIATIDKLTINSSFETPSIQLSTISGTPSTPLNFYYYDGAGTVPVSGAINLINVGYKATRIGNSVSFQLNSFPLATCTNNASPLNIPLPSILLPTSVSRGTVVILNGAVPVVARWNIGGGIMTINAGLNVTDFWTLGNICTIAGGTWNFQWVI